MLKVSSQFLKGTGNKSNKVWYLSSSLSIWNAVLKICNHVIQTFPWHTCTINALWLNWFIFKQQFSELWDATPKYNELITHKMKRKTLERGKFLLNWKSFYKLRKDGDEPGTQISEACDVQHKFHERGVFINLVMWSRAVLIVFLETNFPTSLQISSKMLDSREISNTPANIIFNFWALIL